MIKEQMLDRAVAGSDGQLRILREAYPLFIERGYKAVSMQQIADAAQIHKATLYHHFQDKEEIFTKVVRFAFGQIRTEMEAVIERGGQPSEQLVQIACQMFARTESEFSRLMTDVHENISIEKRDTLMKENAFPWDLMEEIVDRAIKAGEIPDVDRNLVVSMFIGLVSGQIVSRRMERVATPLDEQLARTLVTVLFAGLRAAPSVAELHS